MKKKWSYNSNVNQHQRLTRIHIKYILVYLSTSEGTLAHFPRLLQTKTWYNAEKLFRMQAFFGVSENNEGFRNQK